MTTKLFSLRRRPSAPGKPHLKLDPSADFENFYEHTSVVFGVPADRTAYFEHLVQANPQARFERVGPRDAQRVRELHTELEVLFRLEGNRGAGLYITGNSIFEQRIILVNDLPSMADAAPAGEIATAMGLANIGRICRAVGFTVIYGAADLAEFKRKGWAREATFNAVCNTQVHVGEDGVVTKLERDGVYGPEAEQLAAA